MLQMTTSTLSMFSSSSKSLGGFFGLICVGIQMVLTVILSDSFKTEFTTTARATTTVKMSSSTAPTPFPYVAAMGYATIVFLSLVYILRAKGFGTGDQPPSPPSDADTESNAKKRPNRWLRLLLVLLVSMVLLSLGAGIFVAYLVPSLRVLHPLQAFGAGTLRIAEIKLLEGWTWAFAAIVVVIVPWSVIVAIPQLRWLFWIVWNFTSVPTMAEINHNILRVPPMQPANIVSPSSFRCYLSLIRAIPAFQMILGPATGIYRIPEATIRCLSLRTEQLYCLVFTGVYIIMFTGALAEAFYCALHPQLKPLFWRSLFSPDARSQILPFFWREVHLHQAWKSAQKQDFAILAPKLPHAFMEELRPALELWGSLPWPQKFVRSSYCPRFFSHTDFFLIPNVRRLRRTYARWRKMV
ncbi:hypothetical protein B0H16DRAFT_1566975 [Mycena metata]|uniref:Uncharacterized protein n=1 Tax=Mycena metata TaxID=1033252 RepID=A0AAD7N0T7_9AGAR|nr:hypothetical protein B0H16DRAFT_1566975 [Mycena metata]